VQVKGLSWVGVGTDDFAGTLAFFTDVLGLKIAISDDRGVAMLHVGVDQVLEIFGPGTSGRSKTVTPVVAFEVDDVEAARAELRTQGIELIGDLGRWNGFEWQYFRGPDGHTYAVKKTPPPGWGAGE
jgi:catechol 2,3-dioxygenase-like lactoylglutathione lyase family enzyme